jgi:hypothetical protein
MRRGLAVLVVLAALALAAGCGGGGKQLTKAELVTQADAICRKYEAKINALGEPTSLAGLKEFADKAVPLFDSGLDELRALQPPENLEGTYREWLETGEKQREAAERIGDAADKGDEQGLQRIIRDLGTSEQRSNALAAQLGFKDCAET